PRIESEQTVGRVGKRELYFSRLPLPPRSESSQNEPPPSPGRAQGIPVNPEIISAHLQKDHYGDFWLTDAIRPSLRRQVEPPQGSRSAPSQDPRPGRKCRGRPPPVPRKRPSHLSLDLLAPRGGVVDRALETSHDSDGNSHRDLYRENIDLPVLKSQLCDFEEL